jgi:asparagine synthase (glutamine-hydrolysing)
MSIQAGIWNFDGKPVNREFLADLSGALSWQGPDSESWYVNDSIALLYRSFHTTAESRRERQPYVSHRGFVLTWDGRLDNREELISDVRSHVEDEPTDVAIVAAAFDRWETQSFPRIVGDWSVCIWRPIERELIFATDYMAIRHIFYYLKKDHMWWSTDIAALVQLSSDTFHIHDEYIAGYLARDPGPHLTPYREICQAPPGRFVRIHHGRATFQRYWHINSQSRIRYKTDAEYEEHFRYVFRQSVRRRLRTDSPVLAELSGGLDSSSIVCMADDILANEGAPPSRLDTLSFYDQTEPDGEDWIYFQKVETYRGRIGHHIDASVLGRSPASLEYPEFSALPGYLGAGRQLELERAYVLRNGGYRAVLSGIGGDEFMGGIPDPTAHLSDLIVQFKLISLAKQLSAWSLVKQRPWVQLLWKSLIDLLPASLGQYLASQAKVEPWIRKDFAKRTGLAMRLLGVEEKLGVWLPSRRYYASGIVAMANRLAKSSSSKAAREEIRYPYLDQNLIEFVASIPSDQLLRPGERRSLMRRSLVGLVPRDILSRKTKQFGARTPILALEKNSDQLRLVFKSSLASCLGYINDTYFLETLNAASSGETVHIICLLKTVALEFWLRDLASRGMIDAVTALQQSSRGSIGHGRRMAGTADLYHSR